MNMTLHLTLNNGFNVTAPRSMTIRAHLRHVTIFRRTSTLQERFALGHGVSDRCEFVSFYQILLVPQVLSD